ncbi:MAG: SUMF1/EgtB/PvdO family nonheme iron enzyme [Deltaproteobacteria bacterium]|nr:SUMF1/EgtB/PvdO family nonheme iron enzyme [Deltaproteobacteria bacterium]
MTPVTHPKRPAWAGAMGPAYGLGRRAVPQHCPLRRLASARLAMSRFAIAMAMALVLMSCKGDAPPPECHAPEVAERCTGDTCTIPKGCYTNWWTPYFLKDAKDHVYLMAGMPRYIVLTRAFSIPKTETSREAFDAKMGFDPSGQGGDRRLPVKTTWYQAAAYCNALSQETGQDRCYRCWGEGNALRCEVDPSYEGRSIYACKGYRLPTIAEWVYAYRGGTKTYFYSGAPSIYADTSPRADLIGWYGEKELTPHRPAQKMKNAWGLYDMAGNLAEWTHDPGTSWEQGPTALPGGPKTWPAYPPPSKGPDLDKVPDVDPVAPDMTAFPAAAAMGGSVQDGAMALSFVTPRLTQKNTLGPTVRCVQTLAR